MASASVVGQHPSSLFKLTGGRKKTPPRLFRRSSGSRGESGSVTTEGESAAHPLSPGPAGETAVRGGMMTGEGCGAPAAHAAPRSPDRGSTDCDRRISAGTRQSGTVISDCNSNVDCGSNRNTGGRRATSLKCSGTNDMPNGSVTNGHKAHRHRDALRGRRDTWSGESRHASISSAQAQGDSSGFPLERLTQGRTGVVRLARTEPHRMEAWSIFPRGVDPRVRVERGEGHRFETKPVTQDWCDACSRQITAQALKCQSKYCSSHPCRLSYEYLSIWNK